MARAPKPKVYVTAIGFHDAFVAAPSQKAALAAWGTATDLFGAGRAALAPSGAAHDEALAKPGTVIRRLRGSEDAMLDFAAPEPAAAPRRARSDEAKRAPREAGAASARTKRRPRPKAEPAPPPEPPDRSRLDAAERALDRAERELAEGLGRVAAEREALGAREAALKEAAAVSLGDLGAERDAAKRAYEATVAAFRRR